MALCSTPLPPACEKELVRLTALVPDAHLATLVATEPAFQKGGFRAGNTPVLRTRLQQIACGAGDVSSTLRRALARRSRAHTLTGLIAVEALTEARHALAELLSAPVLLVALLLDERIEVRVRAEGWLQQPAPFLALDPAEAVARLRDLFADLHGLLGCAPQDAGTVPTHEAWLAQKERLEHRLRDLQSENRRLKGVEDRLAGLQRKTVLADEQRDAARQRVQELEKDLRQTVRELEAATVELTRERTHREERVTAAVELALALEFHGWLAQARAVERDAQRPDPHAELLSQAEAALRKQSEADRHSGNRALLTARREQVEQTLATVRAALRNALRPTADLHAVEGALAAENLRLERLLDPNAPASPLEAALAAQFQAARDNDLPRLRELPDLLAALHVLDAPAVARLQAAFQRRVAALEALGVPVPQTENLSPAAALLTRALAGETPAILLLDGHNVLFGLPSRYNPVRGASLTEAEKRQMLARDVVRLAGPNPALRAWLVFDGPTRQDTQAAPNVRVTYSGGQGEHRADGVLLDNIRFFISASPETPILLVSNDQDLCAHARRLGAVDLPVLDFGAFIPH
ncbi:MAG: hypothetical protein KBA18_01555 [Kiritimatiellae bacterium]|nr:hypothetical protein [Kiritimatiellia bacterium]